ncbi:MAG TPA: FIST N-terminal domain-containing protein [Puia sp.]|nr:FIST N-terminal domain-containing protein [Puia sp.]
MKALSSSYSNGIFNDHPDSGKIDTKKVQLVLGFGARTILTREGFYEQLRLVYPAAKIVFASTSGEIFDDKVLDNTVSVTAIEFEKTNIRTASTNINDCDGDSYQAGITLIKELGLSDNLCYIMILSDGGLVNGSELVDGIESILQHRVPVTGGLAGDGIDFNTTVVGLDKKPEPGIIVAIGFYGTSLAIAHCSMGGWEMFGPEIVVTRSTSNRLFGLNDKNALELYRKYLGPYADQLPGSALLFPLSVKLHQGSPPVVRTILSIDTETGCMIFAGDVPQGSKIRFMRANFDRLIDAASEAAAGTLKSLASSHPKLAILISCVGRKIILDNRIDEEVEAVRGIYNGKTLLTGFYSYGEISPLSNGTPCELHNQSITITTFDEL